MFDPRDESILNHAIAEFIDLIYRPYLGRLKCLNTQAADTCTSPIFILKIEALPTSSIANFYIYALTSIGQLGATLGYVFEINATSTVVYLCIKHCKYGEMVLRILEDALLSTFKGAKFKRLNSQEASALLNKLFSSSTANYISITSVVPDKIYELPFSNTLLSLMSGEPLTILLLAVSEPQSCINDYLNQLYSLYNTLSIYNIIAQNYTCSTGKNGSSSSSTTKTTSCSEADSNSNSLSSTTSCSRYVNITPSTPFVLSEARTINTSITINQASGHTTNNHESCSNSMTSSHSKSHASSCTSGSSATNGNALNYSINNLYVVTSLSILSAAANRLRLTLDTAHFCFAAYFISPNPAVSIRSAYTYSGLAKDASSAFQLSYTNTWSYKEVAYKNIMENLKLLNHPCFINDASFISPAVPITSSELFNTVNVILPT